VLDVLEPDPPWFLLARMRSSRGSQQAAAESGWPSAFANICSASSDGGDGNTSRSARSADKYYASRRLVDRDIRMGSCTIQPNCRRRLGRWSRRPANAGAAPLQVDDDLVGPESECLLKHPAYRSVSY
jgi:hypothetical protein